MNASRVHRVMNGIVVSTAVLLFVGCGISQPIPPQVWQPRPQPILQPIGHPMPQPIGQPIGQPISQPDPQPIWQPISQPDSGIFSLSGSAEQQATVRTALDRCTFPFARLEPGLRRAGLNSINISWQSMGDGSLGWASTAGEVGISNSISGLQAQRTAILELGHEVDFFYMTPAMRKAVIRLWHPDASDNHEWFGSTTYWDRNGEAFSAMFLWAFADEELWFDAGYSHKPTRELAAQLRKILLPNTSMN